MKLKTKKSILLMLTVSLLVTLGLAAAFLFGWGNFEQLDTGNAGELITFCGFFAAIAAVILYCIIESLVSYVVFSDSEVYDHRFLFRDRRFSLNEVTGMRISGGGATVSLYIGEKKCFALSRDILESDVLWSSIKGRNYPPQLYKGETPEHFAVKLHGRDYALLGGIWLALDLLVSALYMADSSFLHLFFLYLAPFPVVLLILAAGQQLTVEGDMLRCRRFFKSSSVHIRELKLENGTARRSPELVMRDSGKRFFKLDEYSTGGLYALSRYLEDRGLRCPGVGRMK